MRLYACYSANNHSPLDRLIATIEKRYEPADVLAIDQPLATHAWMEWEDDERTRWGIEAIPPRVHVFDPAIKRGQAVRRYRVPVSDAGARRAWQRALYYDGDTYGALGVALTGALLVAGGAHGGRRAFERLHVASVYCSEILTLLCREAGARTLPLMRPDNVTPARSEAWAGGSGWEPETPAAAAIEARAIETRTA